MICNSDQGQPIHQRLTSPTCSREAWVIRISMAWQSGRWSWTESCSSKVGLLAIETNTSPSRTCPMFAATDAPRPGTGIAQLWMDLLRSRR